jgi:hypothetical protein
MWPLETISLPMRLYDVKWYVKSYFKCIVGIYVPIAPGAAAAIAARPASARRSTCPS